MLASTIVYPSTVVVSPDPLFPTPSTSAVETPENIEEGPDDPEASDEGYIQMKYSVSCVAPLQEQ